MNCKERYGSCPGQTIDNMLSICVVPGEGEHSRWYECGMSECGIKLEQVTWRRKRKYLRCCVPCPVHPSFFSSARHIRKRAQGSGSTERDQIRQQ